MGRIRKIVLGLGVAAPLLTQASGGRPIFFPDDPIAAMPRPAPVKKALFHKLDQPFDFILNSVRWNPRPPTPAKAINTLGNVPDSAWYTNRHGSHRMTSEQLQRGASEGEPPTAPFTVVGGKTEGITPGFRIEDAKGRLYFVKVDPKSNPEMATASDVIVSRFLYAIGYNVPENYIVRARLSDMRLSNKAEITGDTGFSRKMNWDDVKEIVEAIPHYRDRSFRFMASKKVDGKTVGPFYYEGMRADDPNDIIPHEDRRDLRGMYVFFAWLNNTDARAGNTYDVLVEDHGTTYIKHYLIDFGSALGSDGDGPKDARLGHEFMIATPREALRSIVTLGLAPRPWERAKFPNLPAAGNFTSDTFDPDHWASDYPNPAFLSRQPEDDYWAAKQILAFTDDDIRAVVDTGQFTDPRAVEYLTDTLAERRDRIGRLFLSRVLPIDHFRVENSELRFDDLAVQHEFEKARNYDVRWYHFDNMTGQRTLITARASARLPQEALRAAAGSYFSAVIATPAVPQKSVTVTLRKTTSGYRVVGCSRA
jgi:hypothetical protein